MLWPLIGSAETSLYSRHLRVSVSIVDLCLICAERVGIHMEANSNTGYFSAHPPRLEDAGLEDPALSVEGIQEAFRRAAEIMKPGNLNLLGRMNRECINNPGPSNGEWEDSVADALIGRQKESRSCTENQTGGVLEEGSDAIVGPTDLPESIEEGKPIAGETSGPKLGHEGCIRGSNEQDLDVENDSEDPKGADDSPGLTEAFI